ncbi:MAG: GrpB family protein [Chloroflexi bacterium]|uniref:GrpB family protein n=1 Tax=Candidatus Chlorohelix allophototropha TaxID=3003348 RepID=A0A8T7M373_9CHLR|nr:GrpB family protein [Chloroflexota bacterium]WJW65495.1 GrpB family protein [Chloroflexota bacterium L227-S17]
MEEPIVIEEYDPTWSAKFEAEKHALKQALTGRFVAIEHIGSTAVPGLPSKPIIDIMVAVTQLEAGELYARLLEPLGYLYKPDSSNEQSDRLFLRKGTPRSHHLHIVIKGSAEQKRHLAFRDYLLAHPETVTEYAALKLELAQKYRLDREAYTNAKTAFITDIERKAGE